VIGNVRPNPTLICTNPQIGGLWGGFEKPFDTWAKKIGPSFTRGQG